MKGIEKVAPYGDLFPGFRLLNVGTPRGTIQARVRGEGPALLLLHGYPQTHHLWHKVAGQLRDRFTLLCAGLPGYGASYRQPVAANHAGHSKALLQNSA